MGPSGVRHHARLRRDRRIGIVVVGGETSLAKYRLVGGFVSTTVQAQRSSIYVRLVYSSVLQKK
jgi:hypothetical protein